MKRVGLACLLFLFILPLRLNASNVCDNISLSRIMPYMPPDYRIISKKLLRDANLCDMLISVNGKIIPVYANSKIAIIGSLFKDGKSISDKEVNAYLSNQFKKRFDTYGKHLNSLVAADYFPQPSKRNRFFYLVVDPQCPYSNNIKNDIKKICNRLKIGAKLIFISKYKGSEDQISSFVCNKKGFSDYLKDNFGNTNRCKRGSDYIKRSNDLIMDDLRITDTPTIILPSGKKYSGINTHLIEQFIKNNTK
ncbi:thioredoxin fold domain-containing protein [Hippea sp. KM1]|uniref:thioredoxin fold domain-containing protein n=1 Tax=Hippea sp. KM1 TaxID=944481 RepID=UPI00046CBE6F|nr:thioredoxin fold domain-containing protein [Hippea sp. KM1]